MENNIMHLRDESTDDKTRPISGKIWSVDFVTERLSLHTFPSKTDFSDLAGISREALSVKSTTSVTILSIHKKIPSPTRGDEDSATCVQAYFIDDDYSTETAITEMTRKLEGDYVERIFETIQRIMQKWRRQNEKSSCKIFPQDNNVEVCIYEHNNMRKAIRSSLETTLSG